MHDPSHVISTLEVSHHRFRPEEFASRSLPPHISVYTFPECTLNELALELAAAKPSVLPYPAIGTRLSFQLVCPDLRSVSAVNNALPRYAVKDLGSLVLGQNLAGASEPEFIEVGGSTRGGGENKTLNDARFVVGDYISCAILPCQSDGSVAPEYSGRRESSSGFRESRPSRGVNGFQGWDNGFVQGDARESRGARRPSNGGAGSSFIPMGEWRRGERLPPSRPRGTSDGRW